MTIKINAAGAHMLQVRPFSEPRKTEFGHEFIRDFSRNETRRLEVGGRPGTVFHTFTGRSGAVLASAGVQPQR